MPLVTIKRPVMIKVKVTDLWRDAVLQEFDERVKRLDIEIQQMEFQAKKVILNLEKQNNPQQTAAVRQQIEEEKRKRVEAKQEITAKIEEIRALEIGAEVVQGTVDSYIEVGIGDNLSKILQTEIVVENGKIVEIREG